MSDSQFINEFHSLPEEMKKEVSDFISFLKAKRKMSPGKKIRERKFGALKGKIKMAKDFDAPLKEFEEYMQ